MHFRANFTKVHMLRKSPLDATRVYLAMEMATAICWCLVFTTNNLYEATVAGLAPLQLVLVGTTVEVSAFLFSVRLGVALSSLLLSPALLFIQPANGISTSEAERQKVVTEPIL
jgi:hypothetical protein